MLHDIHEKETHVHIHPHMIPTTQPPTPTKKIKKIIKFTFSHTNQEIKGCDIDHKEELNTFITCVFDRETFLQCVNSYKDSSKTEESKNVLF